MSTELDEIAKRSEGLTNLCPEYLRVGIRHIQRNCDLECCAHGDDWEACEQPDRYDGERIAKALADIPWLLDEIERLTPHTVTSAEELWSMPVLSVISDRHGHVYQKFESDDNDAWLACGDLDAWIAEDILSNFGPLAVLHEGAQP